MILTCQNCRARYAVDPQKIGPDGRTVQCARCSHRWFEEPNSPPTAPEIETPPPVPEVVIRPTAAGASLPAVIPPKVFPWPRVIAAAVVVLLLIGVALYFLRHDIARKVSGATGGPTTASTATAATGPARAPALQQPQRPQIEVDLSQSKIEVVDGRYVVRGQLVNNGTAVGSTSLLRVIFRGNDKVLGERYFPMVQGPLQPGARANFTQQLGDPPAGTTDIVPAVE